MNKTVELSIATPCSQRWEGMMESENGRFCKNCNKSVIDFTTYSDQELADFFMKSSGAICGKLRKEQLHKSLPALQHTPGYAVPQFIISSALVIGLGNSTYAKEKQEVPTFIQAEPHTVKEEKENDSMACGDTTHYITGQLLDKETKETIPGATILIEGSTIATATDMNGFFKLDISEYLYAGAIKIVVSCVGYESRTLTYTPENIPLNHIIELEVNKIILGGISYRKATLWERFKYRFVKK